MATTESPAPRILVPLDGSALAEQALPYAVAIGGDAAELTLLEVVPGRDGPQELPVEPGATVEQVQQRYESAGQADLARAARTWLGDRPRVRLEVVGGDPAEQILRRAVELAVDMIVMASHGRGAVGRWTFGSVADRVVRRALVPVMVVRPRDAPVEPGVLPVVRRLLVPLDGSELAARALPEAERLARRLGTPIHLVRAIPPSESIAPVSYEAPFPSSLYEEMYQAARLDAERGLREAAEPLRAAGVTVTEEVLPGPAALAIIDASKPGDVVVMTSHGRTGVRRWLLGSVAEKLIRLGTAPTIVVPSPNRLEAAAAG